jgi:hypothetical protein
VLPQVLFAEIPVVGYSLVKNDTVTKYAYCDSSLRPAGRAGVEAIFCSSSACKDSEGHIYRETSHDSLASCHFLSIALFSECTSKMLGKVGEDIEVTIEVNSNGYH